MLQKTSVGVWNLTFAILSHEIVIAFTMGLELVKYNSSRRMLILSTLFALTCPVGITMGLVVMETVGETKEIDLAAGILQVNLTLKYEGNMYYLYFSPKTQIKPVLKQYNAKTLQIYCTHEYGLLKCTVIKYKVV